MNVKGLICVRCGERFPPDDRFLCSSCQGILDVEYYANNIRVPLSKSFDFMPISRAEMVGIGVHETPHIHSRTLGPSLGLNQLYFKCEQTNLSGSFKDRPESVAVAMAKRFGYEQVIVASSGNAASATASCAAKMGLKCVVLIPESAPEEKMKQAQFYGAEVFRIKGPYSNCFNVAKELSHKYHLYNVTTTFLNPYAIEGDKLVGYEIFESREVMPNYIYVPIGAGPLLVGIYKSSKEYRFTQGNGQLPKMIGVQAEGSNPIAKAFMNGTVSIVGEKSPKTIAGGIADGLVGYEQDGEYTLKICRESGGAVYQVGDEEIVEAQELLAKEEGLFVEPSAAAAMAGVVKGCRENKFKENDYIVVVLTGHGLKDISAIAHSSTTVLHTSSASVAEALFG